MSAYIKQMGKKENGNTAENLGKIGLEKGHITLPAFHAPEHKGSSQCDAKQHALLVGEPLPAISILRKANKTVWGSASRLCHNRQLVMTTLTGGKLGAGASKAILGFPCTNSP